MTHSISVPKFMCLNVLLLVSPPVLKWNPMPALDLEADKKFQKEDVLVKDAIVNRIYGNQVFAYVQIGNVWRGAVCVRVCVRMCVRVRARARLTEGALQFTKDRFMHKL